MLNFPECVWSKRSTNDFALDIATGNVIIQTDESFDISFHLVLKCINVACICSKCPFMGSQYIWGHENQEIRLNRKKVWLSYMK